MKKLMLVSILMGWTFLSASAQRTPGERILFKAMELPEKPLPVEYTTYSLQFDDASLPLAARGAANSSQQRIAKVAGFEQVPAGGDFTVKMAARFVEITTPKIVSSGGDKPTYTYQYDLSMMVDVDAKSNSTGESLFLVGPATFKHTAISSSFATQAKLSDWYKSAEGQEWYRASRQDFFDEAWTSRFYLVNKYLGYPVVKYNMTISTAKNRNQDYSDLDELQTLAISAFKSLDGTEVFPRDHAEFAQKMRAAIEGWEKALEEYKPGKNNRINEPVAAALMENLAWGYRFLDEYAAAEAVLTKAESTFSKKKYYKWTKDIWENIAKRKERLTNDPRFEVPTY